VKCAETNRTGGIEMSSEDLDNEMKAFLLGEKDVMKREIIISRETPPNGKGAYIREIDVNSGLEIRRYWKRTTDEGVIRLSKPKREQSNQTGGRKPFTKVYQCEMTKALTSDDFGTLPERKNQAFLLLVLMGYADRGTGRIHKKRKPRKGTDVFTQSDIAEISGLSVATVNKTLKQMVKSGLLQKKDGYYHLVWRYSGRG
jgi:hypothetical protein